MFPVIEPYIYSSIQELVATKLHCTIDSTIYDTRVLVAEAECQLENR